MRDHQTVNDDSTVLRCNQIRNMRQDTASANRFLRRANPTGVVKDEKVEGDECWDDAISNIPELEKESDGSGAETLPPSLTTEFCKEYKELLRKRGCAKEKTRREESFNTSSERVDCKKDEATGEVRTNVSGGSQVPLSVQSQGRASNNDMPIAPENKIDESSREIKNQSWFRINESGRFLLNSSADSSDLGQKPKRALPIVDTALPPSKRRLLDSDDISVLKDLSNNIKELNKNLVKFEAVQELTATLNLFRSDMATFLRKIKTAKLGLIFDY